jgi:hypothetical protein
MANYLLLYYDGATTPSSNKKLLNKLAAWEEQEIGNALVDNGATFEESDTKAVKVDHHVRPPKDRLKGFSIIKARSLSEALEISSGSPILREGGRVAVYKTDRSGD